MAAVLSTTNPATLRPATRADFVTDTNMRRLGAEFWVYTPVNGRYHGPWQLNPYTCYQSIVGLMKHNQLFVPIKPNNP